MVRVEFERLFKPVVTLNRLVSNLFPTCFQLVSSSPFLPFAFAGLASQIRFLLEVAGADYDEELYKQEHPDKWFKEKKENLGMQFAFSC